MSDWPFALVKFAITNNINIDLVLEVEESRALQGAKPAIMILLSAAFVSCDERRQTDRQTNTLPALSKIKIWCFCTLKECCSNSIYNITFNRY